MNTAIWLEHPTIDRVVRPTHVRCASVTPYWNVQFAQHEDGWRFIGWQPRRCAGEDADQPSTDLRHIELRHATFEDGVEFFRRRYSLAAADPTPDRLSVGA